MGNYTGEDLGGEGETRRANKTKLHETALQIGMESLFHKRKCSIINIKLPDDSRTIRCECIWRKETTD